MARIPFRIVDVFTERPFGGNPLCVVTGEINPELMQKIATEIAMPETTFPKQTGPDSYAMRIFTSQREIPFAGHPSLGTAWTLGPGTWEQTTSGATVSIDVDEHGAWMQQPEPIFGDITVAADVAEASDVTIDTTVHASIGGLTFLVAVTPDDLSTITPNEAAMGKLLNDVAANGLAICRKPEANIIEVRTFFPEDAIFEDAGTGSLAGILGTLGHQHWGAPADIVIRQGHYIHKPCRINVHASPGELSVGGPVHLVAEGEFAL